MQHPLIFSEDLAPGYPLTFETLEANHARILAAFAEDPEHSATLASLPWASKILMETARGHIATASTRLYDFDLAFNYWNWIYQFALYGEDYDLAWDRLEQSTYPCLSDQKLNAFTHAQGLEFIENRDEVIDKWQPILPGLIDRLEVSGVRIICNHATWMSQGFLVVMLHEALRVYCTRFPGEKQRVAALGLLDPIDFGRRAHTLLGPWITTLGHKLSPAVSDLPAMGAIQAISNVIKVFPDTPSGRFLCCHRRWQREVRKVLRILKTLENTPGALIFETPSGMQDACVGGSLVPQPMAKAAIRLSRVRPNHFILVGMDERDLFEINQSIGGFRGGGMRHGRLRLAINSYLSPRDMADATAPWPVLRWQDMERQIAGLVSSFETSGVSS